MNSKYRNGPFLSRLDVRNADGGAVRFFSKKVRYWIAPAAAQAAISSSAIVSETRHRPSVLRKM